MAIEPIPLHRDDTDRRPPGAVARDIDRVLAGLGAPPAPVLTRIAQRWSDVVGPAAAPHCHPGRLVGGVLHIDVDEPAWASQMRWQQQGVLARLADLVPEAGITAVTTRVRPRSPGVNQA